MRKLGLLLWMLAFTAVGAQAQNIIKSLERTVPGQGKVTIHQDPKIEALIGVERPSMGEQKVLKAAGFRIQAYAGNNTREAKNDAYRVASRIKESKSIFRSCRYILRSFHPVGFVVWVISGALKRRTR